LIERKGYKYLVEALKGIPNVRLCLAGDGNLKNELAAQAAELGVRVEFLGPKSKSEVADLLRASDLFVLPSLNEGMSNSLLEALATGLPAVVTDVGGSAELVTDGRNGYIVEKADAAALRRCIHIYLRNQKLPAVHGRTSRQIAETMSIERNAEQYISLYRNAAVSPTIEQR
jgi:glycosyltransferase involved in cell wall biosynthesis